VTEETENYYTKYWKNWFFKAHRANEIIANLEKKEHGADILWSFNRWFKRLIDMNKKEN